ncbi:MAG: hypothetical protein OEX23_15690 [Betaproteobacteria bacterium]|nr:hypothetical protein [Betaproteobacteria bacterium]
MIDFLALAAGLGLVWVLGVALIGALFRLLPPREALPVPWVAGCGWFVGMIAATLLMRAISAAGVTFGVLSIGAPLLAIAAVAGWLAWRGRGAQLRGTLRTAARALGGAGLEGWQRLAWRLIVAWLAVRFALLFAEVWWRPLYPWDAWTQWATKARAWFEMRTMVPFAGVTDFLSAPAGTMFWFDAAPHYPATMPLMQTWGALVVGRWDDALVNLPWWLTGLALAFGLHGGMRLLGFAPLASLAAAALACTLPIVNVHVALAGYADLPIAGYLALGTIAMLHAVRTRGTGELALAVALLLSMALVKNPGKAWVLMLLPAFVAAAIPRHGARIAVGLLAAAVFALLVGARSGITLLGYKFYLQPVVHWNALFDAYFSFANWHLLWYATVAAAVLGWRHLLDREVAPLTIAVASGLLFLFIGFAFTHAGQWVEDQSTVNRATLHLAPLAVVWLFACVRALVRAGREPVPAVP